MIYKIGSWYIAQRMKQILDNMSSDQTGVVPGRNIGENTTLIYTLMQYTKENNTPGLLDSEKPLILSHGNLIKHYYCFYFGPSFKDGYHFTFRYSIYSNTSWIFIIFFFKLERGQGDPILT